jgi:hypothetical protein
VKSAAAITIGGAVWVYPHGRPDEAVTATVDLISSNGLSIAIRLSDKPSWCRIANGFLLHTQYSQIEMLLMRHAIDGQPIGPWVEIVGGGHYEIEERPPIYD